MSPAVLTPILGPLQFPWVIYALDQNNDHFDRAFALANLAAATGRQVFLLTNSLQAKSVQKQVTNDNLSIQLITPDAALKEVVHQVTQLLSIAPFVLIVDALPTGLQGELVNILPQLPNIPKILVLQDFGPDTIIANNLRHLIKNYYDLGIVPGIGEGSVLADLPNVVQTGPWLMLTGPSKNHDIKNHTDKNSGAIALQTAALAEGSDATVLVLSSGEPNELDIYSYIANIIAQQCPWVTVRCHSPVPPTHCDIELWDSHWPVSERILAADLVIGAGNYGTVHLCQRLKIPLIAFPWSRPDNLQRKRLEKIADIDEAAVKIVTSAEEALCHTFDFLNQGIEKSLFSPQKRWQNLHRTDELDDINGIKVGLRLIEETLANKWDQVAQTAMTQDINRLRQSQYPSKQT